MWRHVILFTLVAPLPGCGTDDAPIKPTHAEPKPVAQPSTNISRLDRLTLTSQFDFPEDRWQSEQFSQRIQVQLDRWAKSIQRGMPSGDLFADGLVSSGFASTNLRPKELDKVYDDAQMIVRRASSVDDHYVTGAEPTQRLAAEWLEWLDGATDIHVKFKIASIESHPDHAVTDLVVQLSGQHPDHRYQQTAMWRCEWQVDTDLPSMRKLTVVEYEEVESTVAFSDCTAAVIGDTKAFQDQLRFGLDHWLDRLEIQFGIATTGYQGLAIGDANGDGLDDLFVAQPGGILAGLPNRLFLQRADGTVEDVSESAGVDWNAETHSALFLDLDNDGDQDLVVATVLGIVFAENDGSARFEVRAVKLTPEAPPMSMAASDFDDDGDLDVFACCYSNRISTEIMGRPIPYHDANNGGRNMLFRNDRDWRFRDVTRAVGLDTNNRRFSFAAAWEDYDNDGDLDLYVANDYGRNNLYRNDQARFVDVAARLGVEDMSAGMSVTWGDYNLDGWMDLYISNMWSSAGNRIAFQRQFKSSADPSIRQQYQRHARGNSLFANRGPGNESAFEDISLTAGVNMGRWAWGSQFVDLNNDSYEDLFIVNGFITQEDTTDL